MELTVVDADDRGDHPAVHLPEPARRALGVLSGDQVVVEADRAVVATAWPAGRDTPDDGAGLGPAAQRLAGAATGRSVRVRPVRVDDAISVTVEAAGDGKAPVAAAVREALRHRPVWAGDRYPVDGGTIAVIDTRPTGPVRVTDDTKVNRQDLGTGGADEPSPAGDAGHPDDPGVDQREQPSSAVDTATPRASYDDIGGLDEELALVREMVELPLAEPELFARLGIDPPTGVLLYGPPGTGKTLIVEALAGAIDATVYHVSGPELTSKYKGESEARLREVFDRARRTAPSVVFFDEIDAIAGRREDGGDMEGRVVAQLLTLLDGLDPRGDVVVIGATNRLDALDPALRRPGRFDREIQIGVPDEADRREILAVHADGVPLADDVDLDRVAARTHGFVGADLKALVTEAAMAALRRVREGGGDPAAVTVGRADVEAALAGVEPSAMREVVAEMPATSFDDVGDLEDAKATLRKAVQWPLEHPELFEAAGTDPPAGILLYGPPGTGKTLLARALAHESGVNVIHVRGPELLDKYVGESERAVREVFERARQVAPALVFFDEIDAIAGRRVGAGDVAERVVSQLLTELDGLADNPNLVVVAATNRKEAIDPALLRPGRLDTHVEVPPPDEAARRAILAVHARDAPLADDVDLDAVAAALDGATGAAVAAVVRDASMRAIREAVDDGAVGTVTDGSHPLTIRQHHFEAALAERRE
ncbi:MAG: AAA family ATPase [Halobacteriales archaeon]